MKITYFASKSMYKLFYLSKLFIIKCLKMQFKMFFFLLSCLLCLIITMVQALTIEPYVCLNDS